VISGLVQDRDVVKMEDYIMALIPMTWSDLIGFVDDVVLAHNGASASQSKTTLCFVNFARQRHWGKSCCLWLQACMSL